MSSQSSLDSDSDALPSVIPQDSPRKRAAPRISERRNMNLEQDRDLYIDDARGYVRQSVVADFYDTYVPDWQRPSEEQVDKIVALLKKRHVCTETEWTSLPATPKKGVLENEHYAGLEPISEAIMKAAEDIRLYSRADRTTKFQCRPNSTTSSEVRGGSFRVDGYNVLEQTTFPVKMRSTRFPRTVKLDVINYDEKEVVYTSDLAMTMEVKLDNDKGTIFEDERQVIGGTGHIMFNDPCRNWHFNLTIEANYARLWVHTRSHSTVTKSFNIQKNPAELIHFFLFLGYATKEQLGFDPTVARVLDDEGEIQYRYEVVDLKGQVRWFQTVAILEQRSAARLHSRAMRVFHVREVDAEGKLLVPLKPLVPADVEPAAPDSAEPVAPADAEPAHADAQLADSADAQSAAPILSLHDNVLRDFWAYESAASEYSIQRDIFRRLNELPEEDYGDNLRDIKDHFMDFICDMVVGRNVPAPPANATVYQFPDRSNPSNRSSAGARVKNHLQSNAEEMAPTAPAVKPKEASLALHARKHCRTVHKHLCVDIYQIDDPAEFFFVLSQCIAILKRFRRAGYLHRDVSPGNFLVYCLIPRHLPPPGGDFSKKFVVKVADLEYAKLYEVISRHDPMTGTAYYAAVEVQRRKHLFNDTANFTVRKLGALFFAANFYHDVESVIWMAIDYIVHRIPLASVNAITAAKKSGVSVDGTVDQLDDRKGHALAEKLSAYASQIFTTDIRGTPDREDLMTSIAGQDRLIKLLKKTHGRSSVITRHIPELLQILAELYLELEKEVAPRGKKLTLRFDIQSFVDRIYDAMYKAFGQISQHFQQHPTKFIPTADILTPPKDEKPSKRSRDDLDEELAGVDAEDAPPQKKRSRQSGYPRSHQATGGAFA